MKEFREATITADAEIKRKEREDGPKASYGYGGKFGVQEDRYCYVLSQKDFFSFVITITNLNVTIHSLNT